MSTIEIGVRPNPEINPLVLRTSEKISDVLSWWLAEEITSSGQGNNAVLDDYNRAIRNLVNQGDPSTEPVDAKWSSHHTRLKEFTSVFSEAPENPDLFARQLFCIMMNISGASREQFRLGAHDQDDYMQKRHQSVVGVDILQSITNRVWWHRFVKPMEEQPPDATQIVNDTLRANELSREWVDFLVRRGEYDLHKTKTETIAMIQIAQTLWLDLMVDYIMFLNERNQYPFGDIASTPILEPKSITLGPRVIYPFAR